MIISFSLLSPSFAPNIFTAIIMTKTILKSQYFKGEGKCSNKGKEVHSWLTNETTTSWPFTIKLTPDHIRWDSLKISPSKELEEHILWNIDEASRKLLDAWIPIELCINDVDTCETYKVKLAKKESFWFEPIPEKTSLYHEAMVEEPCYDLEKKRKEFAYSIEPFRQITKRRSLGYDHEIGLRWSSSKSVNIFEFSVLNGPGSDLRNLIF